MIADNIDSSLVHGLEVGGQENSFPPKGRGRPRGMTVERLARLKWIAGFIEGSFKAVNVHDLQDIVGNRFEVSARQVRDDLMLFRGPKGKEQDFVFWKNQGRPFIWTNKRRYDAATRPRDGSLEAFQ